MLVCAWGVALGALLRSSSAAITSMAFVLVVTPVIVQILPTSIVHLVGPWLPSQIGTQAVSAQHDPQSFAAWPGLGVLAGYVAITAIAGGWRMVRQDP